MKKSITNIKRGGGKTCSRILTPKQVGPICWFMATFVAMFYSQRSRKLLIESSKNWDERNELFRILKHVLDDKYLKSSAGKESDDYREFSDNTFIDILKLLHKENKKTFMYNPKLNKGFSPHFYIGKLYNLLNIKYTIFEYDNDDDFLTYSLLNEEYNDDINLKIVQKYNRLKKYNEILYYKFTLKPRSNFEKNIKKISSLINRSSSWFQDAHTQFNKRDKLLNWFNDNSLRFKDIYKRFDNTPSVLIVIVRNDTYDTAIYGEGVYYQKGNNVLNNMIDDPDIKKNIQSM